MKILFLVGGSRAGIDLFQSLLDGHPQILQFPGIIHTNKNSLKKLSSKNGEELYKNFINDYRHFFDSRLNKVERHYMLGKNKNEYYTVDEEKFKYNFNKNFYQISKSNNKNQLYKNLIALHISYAETCNHKIDLKKIMAINCHLVSSAAQLAKKLDNIEFDIIHTIRNPLSSVSSIITNWLQYDDGKHFFAKSIFGELDLIVNGIKKLIKINKKIILIQLEMLHTKHSQVINDFCKIYNLSYNKCLEHSTYFNLDWWGDVVSGKDLNGINKNFSIKFNENNFYERDIKFLEYILNDYMLFYNYNFTRKISNISINFLPLKCEILTWKNSLKQKNIKNILSIPLFYFFRILFVNKFSQKNLKMPISLGAK